MLLDQSQIGRIFSLNKSSLSNIIFIWKLSKYSKMLNYVLIYHFHHPTHSHSCLINVIFLVRLDHQYLFIVTNGSYYKYKSTFAYSDEPHCHFPSFFLHILYSSHDESNLLLQQTHFLKNFLSQWPIFRLCRCLHLHHIGHRNIFQVFNCQLQKARWNLPLDCNSYCHRIHNCACDISHQLRWIWRFSPSP